MLACEASCLPNLPLHLLFQLCMFWMCLCPPPLRGVLKHLPIMWKGLLSAAEVCFSQSYCKYYVNFIVVPRHVLTSSVTWRSLNNTIWLFSQFGLMRDDTLPLIICPVLSALLNYIVPFLRWMDVQGASDSPPLVLFQHTLSFITAAYWSAAFTEPPRMFLGLSSN